MTEDNSYHQATSAAARAVNRAADVVGSYSTFGVAPENVSATIEAEARCRLIFGVLESFTRFCYESSGSVLVNLSGNFRIPGGVYVPFGSSGKHRKNAKGRRPQLTQQEREIVRLWLLWLHQKGKRPVFYYDIHSRRWNVDTAAYKNLEQALDWLKTNVLLPKNYLYFKGQLK